MYHLSTYLFNYLYVISNNVEFSTHKNKFYQICTVYYYVLWKQRYKSSNIVTYTSLKRPSKV